MVRLYLDTSAAAKLIVEEAESAALIDFLDGSVAAGDQVMSSALLETELRRVAMRLDLAQSSVSDVLDRVHLALPDKLLFRTAGLLAGRHLRSLDALHVASALRLDAAQVITYDKVLAEVAVGLGLRIVAPSSSGVAAEAT